MIAGWTDTSISVETETKLKIYVNNLCFSIISVLVCNII